LTLGILSIFIAFAVSHFAKKDGPSGPNPEPPEPTPTPPEPFLPNDIQKADILTSNNGPALCITDGGNSLNGISNDTEIISIDFDNEEYRVSTFFGSNCTLITEQQFGVVPPVTYDIFRLRTGGGPNEYVYARELPSTVANILDEFGAKSFDLRIVPDGITILHVLLNTGNPPLCTIEDEYTIQDEYDGFTSPKTIVVINYTNETYEEIVTNPMDECTSITELDVSESTITYERFYSLSFANRYLYVNEDTITTNDLLTKFSATGFTEL